MINLQFTTIKSPLPDFIYQGLKSFSADANTYHSQPKDLIVKLATKYNLPETNIFLTAGADEAIQLFAKIYGQNAFVFTPTYIVYHDVETFGGKLTQINSLTGTEFKIDPKEYSGATLIYLANPNNPSGFTAKVDVIKLLENNPQAIVVIDEAYGDFADLSVINEINNYPNLAVIRSFSKSYGMAGNRVGFVATANLGIIKKLLAFSQWCNVSYLSVGAALTALDHEDYFQQIREEIKVTRTDFNNFLVKSGYQTIPSLINAQLIKFDSETKADQFVAHLKKNDIIVSQGNGFSNLGLDNSFVRIAIGTKDQIEKVKKAITEFKKD